MILAGSDIDNKFSVSAVSVKIQNVQRVWFGGGAWSAWNLHTVGKAVPVTFLLLVKLLNRVGQTSCVGDYTVCLSVNLTF